MRAISEGVVFVTPDVVVVLDCGSGSTNCMRCLYYVQAVVRGPNQPKDVVYCKRPEGQKGD